MLPTVHPITVLIADAHALFRQRLRRFLARQADIQVVGEAANGRQVLGSAEVLRPDILLLDVELVQMGGLEEVARIRARSPVTKILLLTDVFEEEGIIRVLQRGAKGYLLKTARPTELMKAIRTTHSGELWVPRKLLTRLLANLYRRFDQLQAPLSAIRETLTEREQEVVIWAMQGMTNNEIAAQLGISPKTVKTHLQNAFRKLNIRRRSQLLRDYLSAPPADFLLPHGPFQSDNRT